MSTPAICKKIKYSSSEEAETIRKLMRHRSMMEIYQCERCDAFHIRNHSERWYRMMKRKLTELQ